MSSTDIDTIFSVLCDYYNESRSAIMAEGILNLVETRTGARQPRKKITDALNQLSQEGRVSKARWRYDRRVFVYLPVLSAMGS